jgi:hypothetical protein
MQYARSRICCCLSVLIAIAPSRLALGLVQERKFYPFIYPLGVACSLTEVNVVAFAVPSPGLGAWVLARVLDAGKQRSWPLDLSMPHNCDKLVKVVLK